MSIEHEPNCVGYAFASLGIIDEADVLEHIAVFDLLDEAPLAYASGIFSYASSERNPPKRKNTSHSSIGLRRRFSAKADKSCVKHRREYGCSETTDNLESLLRKYANPKFDIKYVKLRPT